MRLTTHFFAFVASILAGALAASIIMEARAQQDQSAHASMTLSIVTGIVNYTRWPHLDGKLRICLAGESDYSARITGELPQSIQAAVGMPASISTLQNPEAAVSQCDLVYVGRWKEPYTKQLISAISGQPVLSIGENRDFCSQGGMFCLDLNVSTPGEISFATNLDAISRSKVRVNPQVLRLAARLKAAQ